MTELREKIAKAIHNDDFMADGSPFGDSRASALCRQMADVALSVIRANAADLVKPLEWKDCGNCSDARVFGVCYAVRFSFVKAGWVLTINGLRPKDDVQGTLEEAKKAAQEHHNKHVLSLLNLGEPDQ